MNSNVVKHVLPAVLTVALVLAGCSSKSTGLPGSAGTSSASPSSALHYEARAGNVKSEEIVLPLWDSSWTSAVLFVQQSLDLLLHVEGSSKVISVQKQGAAAPPCEQALTPEQRQNNVRTGLTICLSPTPTVWVNEQTFRLIDPKVSQPLMLMTYAYVMLNRLGADKAAIVCRSGIVLTVLYTTQDNPPHVLHLDERDFQAIQEVFSRDTGMNGPFSTGMNGQC